MMKHASWITRIGFAIVLCLGVATALIPASTAAGGNRCKDHCNRTYQERKDSCRGLHGNEKHHCEERAKREHEECRHHCQ